MRALSITKTKNDHRIGCVAAAVTILGDKWIPLLIKELASGTVHFCQLQRNSGGVNPRTLSSKLDYLEKSAVVKKKVFHSIPIRTEYYLTEKGRELIPILEQMAAWSKKHRKPNG